MVYRKEFKDKALSLSDEVGLREAADRLGIPYYTLSHWRYDRKQRAKQEAEQEGYSADQWTKRIHDLEQEVETLRRENKALKDTIVFFAVAQKKLGSEET